MALSLACTTWVLADGPIDDVVSIPADCTNPVLHQWVRVWDRPNQNFFDYTSKEGQVIEYLYITLYVPTDTGDLQLSVTRIPRFRSQDTLTLLHALWSFSSYPLGPDYVYVEKTCEAGGGCDVISVNACVRNNIYWTRMFYLPLIRK